MDDGIHPLELNCDSQGHVLIPLQVEVEKFGTDHRITDFDGVELGEFSVISEVSEVVVDVTRPAGLGLDGPVGLARVRLTKGELPWTTGARVGPSTSCLVISTGYRRDLSTMIEVPTGQLPVEIAVGADGIQVCGHRIGWDHADWDEMQRIFGPFVG
ncbi:hypothetical protein [Luteolibacter marinus]|uniref:hypothetical protein n=1 Tax=Luteolibacter marinus TaxID=2776705 RepID=UPI0018686ABA|nr:hypothetical protein [Luteolibacter marinus]